MKAVLVCFIKLLILWPAMLQAQDAPVSTVSSIVTDQETAVISITASNFDNIGSCNLKLQYDPGIASAVSVQTSPQLGGMLSTDLNVPGVIYLGWYRYPAVTLPDSTVIFNITFAKINAGTTAIEWDDESGYTCDWWNGSFTLLNDLPTSFFYKPGSLTFLATNAPQTYLEEIIACETSIISLPVVVSNFSTIGSFLLTLNYDAQAIEFIAVENQSGFPSFSFQIISPGVLAVNGQSNSLAGISLPDQSVLFTLSFLAQDATSQLTWQTGITGCYYTGPAPSFFYLNDLPYDAFYINGSLSGLPLPAQAGPINGPAGGQVCAGQENVVFMVEAIEHAESYSWSLPPNALITSGANSNIITVTFQANAENGIVSVYGENNCGSGIPSPPYAIVVNQPPLILQQPVSPPAVLADSGIAVFSVAAQGTSLQYRWQEFSGSWNNIADEGVFSGTLTEVLTITNPPYSMNGNKYRCIITGLCNPQAITDGEATLSVVPLLGDDVLLPAKSLELNFYTQIDDTGICILMLETCRAGSGTIQIYNVSGSLLAGKHMLFPGHGKYRVLSFAATPGLYLARILFVSENLVQEKTIKWILH